MAETLTLTDETLATTPEVASPAPDFEVDATALIRQIATSIPGISEQDFTPVAGE